VRVGWLENVESNNALTVADGTPFTPQFSAVLQVLFVVPLHADVVVSAKAGSAERRKIEATAAKTKIGRGRRKRSRAREEGRGGRGTAFIDLPTAGRFEDPGQTFSKKSPQSARDVLFERPQGVGCARKIMGKQPG
jgi:hypothetical protein